MSVARFAAWQRQYWVGERHLFAARLPGDGTGGLGGRRPGTFVPGELLSPVFPGLWRDGEAGPGAGFRLRFESHRHRCYATAARHAAGVRVTVAAGCGSPFSDEGNCGALALLSFGDAPVGSCDAWVCGNAEEEDFFAESFGDVVPGGHMSIPALSETEGGASKESPTPDVRLLYRWRAELELMSCVENEIVPQAATKGFPTVESFLVMANSIMQRRKARSGVSLERQVKKIFDEEGLVEGEDYSFQPVSENRKRPDFLFPNQKSYQDGDFPAGRLRMLAVKTSCRDRWRQVLNEADRIDAKHLFTLQESVSENQFGEMRGSGVKLVVPKGLHEKYPKGVRGELMSLEEFIGEVKRLAGPSG